MQLQKKERGGVSSLLVGALAMLGAGTVCVVLMGLYKKGRRRRRAGSPPNGQETVGTGEEGKQEAAVAGVMSLSGVPLRVDVGAAGGASVQVYQAVSRSPSEGLRSPDDGSEFSLEAMAMLENLTDVPSVPSMSEGEEEGASTLGEEDGDTEGEKMGRGWGLASNESCGKEEGGAGRQAQEGADSDDDWYVVAAQAEQRR